jgi:hypothetical protein
MAVFRAWFEFDRPDQETRMRPVETGIHKRSAVGTTAPASLVSR